MSDNHIPPSHIQARLLQFAGLYLFFIALALTISPAARARSWDVEYRWLHWIGFAVWVIAASAAHRHSTRKYPEADPFILPIAALLTGWGLLSIWRLTEGFGLRQTFWVAISTIAFIYGLRASSHLDFLRRYKYLWLTGGILLTALTFFFGTNPAATGPNLWLGCCGVYFQPSEPLKLLLIVYLAAYFAENRPIQTRLLPIILPTLIMAGLALAVLLIQRDLGTSLIMTFLYSGMLYLASGKKRILAISIGLLSATALAGYYLIGIIQLRIASWLNPWLDPSGRSYQIVQSLLAVANGGLFGRGLGLGSPGLVPVAHSDFIFTSMAEETGLIGSFALFMLVAILVLRGFTIAIRADNEFKRLLASGLSLYVGAQSILIIGGNLRLLPLTGVTLPFVSYGGSSLLTSYMALLTLTLISSDEEIDPAPLHSITPTLTMAGVIFIGLFSAALLNGWWAIWRSDDLLQRTDNARRAISDRYVIRGSIVDRHNEPISTTTGEVGEYQRVYLLPDLSPIIGYTHPVYGQAGLEESLDPYLRGLRGNPASLVWWDHLLYGQPPQGLDVRISIDSNIQIQADKLLGEHKGAIVLLNAVTGEILAIASHPTYNANLLDEIGPTLVNDEDSPLLNRAVNGRYTPGTALGPFLLTATVGAGTPYQPETQITDLDQDCALPPEDTSIAGLVSAGCETALNLKTIMPAEEILRLLKALKFIPQDTNELIDLNKITISPMQMALAASALSNNGLMPSPEMEIAVDTPGEGWVILPMAGQAEQVFGNSVANNTAALLLTPGTNHWETVGIYRNEGSAVSWYIGGILPGHQGAQLAIALVLEENNPALARSIGRQLLEKSILPDR